jgi:hypothetical protein
LASIDRSAGELARSTTARSTLAIARRNLRLEPRPRRVARAGLAGSEPAKHPISETPAWAENAAGTKLPEKKPAVLPFVLDKN